ncbi:MAG TPA: potassium transporter Kup [Terrimicrobiaceae bacterium]|nr:potassium transporter Kup [Terrimicrobiaceae bacterium]
MKATNRASLGSALGALGIVYGDIGTSVLYAFRECLSQGIGGQEGVLGVLSLIIWTLTLLVTIKYLTFVTRADNQGEGGILALLALAFPQDADGARRSKLTILAIAMGVGGASLLYGDGVITPAISVLAATEGLSVAAPWLAPFTVPVTVIILIALFSFQKRGTESVARLFGPVMLVWFLTLAGTGVAQIARHPSVLEAINPLHAVSFLLSESGGALVILGSIFLVATGAEALYADLGHFGRRPIALAWYWVVFPSLLLNYLGQGALILQDPSARENPFFHMVPGWLLWPLIVLATAATVIASQALISGAFSLTMQAVQMGYVPFINIRHTSHEERGQVYIPQINTLLAVGCIALVIGFRSSDALASAYGIAVTLAMISTTLLFYFAARRLWNWSVRRAGALCGVFLLVEGSFLVANSTKVVEGGWLPLAIGVAVFLLMTTWKKGRHLLRVNSPPMLSLRDLIVSTTALGRESGLPARVPGTALFLSARPVGAPMSLLHNLKHNRVLHERNIVLTVVTVRVPHVPRAERVEIKNLPENFFRIIAHFGFMETPAMSEIIASCAAKNFVIDEQKTSFFLGLETIVCTNKPGMTRWRGHLFAAMSRHAQKPAEFFKLPVNRVIELGQRVEI